MRSDERTAQPVIAITANRFKVLSAPEDYHVVKISLDSRAFVQFVCREN